MIFTKFHENRLIIDGEINEKHVLLVSCGLRYIRLSAELLLFVIYLLLFADKDCIDNYKHVNDTS